LNPIKTAVIPEAFSKIYGANAKYAFVSCIQELKNYLESLTPLLLNGETKEIRRILHQMTGTAGLLLHEELCKQIEVIKSAVRSQEGYQILVKEVAKLEMELSRLYHRTITEYPSKKILIFGDSSIDLGMLTYKISTWSEEVEIHHETMAVNLLETVRRILPEILVVFTNNATQQLSDGMQRIEKNYYGITVFQLHKQADWQRLRETLITA